MARHWHRDKISLVNKGIIIWYTGAIRLLEIAGHTERAIPSGHDSRCPMWIAIWGDELGSFR